MALNSRLGADILDLAGKCDMRRRKWRIPQRKDLTLIAQLLKVVASSARTLYCTWECYMWLGHTCPGCVGHIIHSEDYME